MNAEADEARAVAGPTRNAYAVTPAADEQAGADLLGWDESNALAKPAVASRARSRRGARKTA